MSERPKCGCGDHRHVYAIECHAYRDALREAADVPCRFCHTPASAHDVTSCPRHFYHPEWSRAEGSNDEQG